MNQSELLDALYAIMQDNRPRTTSDILSLLPSANQNISSEFINDLLNDNPDFHYNKLSKKYRFIAQEQQIDKLVQNRFYLSDEVKSIFNEIDQALIEEKNEVKNNTSGQTYITNGTYMGERTGKTLYSFTIDKELFFPIDSPLIIKYKGKSIEGTLVVLDDISIVVLLDEYIGDSIPLAILTTDPWYLIEKLRIRIQSLVMSNATNLRLAVRLLEKHPHKSPDLATPDLFDFNHDLSTYIKKDVVLNDSQTIAIHKVAKSEIIFIWGPPGTGKTKTLSMTCVALMQQGESILVVAHSNVAVDVAMMGIAQALENTEYLDRGAIIRVGIPQHSDMKQPLFEKMNIRGILKRKYPLLIQKIEQVEKQLQQKTKQIANDNHLAELDKTLLFHDIETCKSQLVHYNDQIKQHEKEYLENARVIGCTFSKLAISEDLNKKHFGAVLIDEASMASVPNCIFASSFATQRVAIYGDFRQLAPIAISENKLVKKWLWRDVFSHAGITDAVGNNIKDQRLILLDTQYRMHPIIANMPNKLFYNNFLFTGQDVLATTKSITNRSPMNGECIINIDPSLLSAICVKEKESKSRFNLVSAICSLIYLEQSVLDGSSVGIETPYNAQSRLINRMLRDLKYKRETAMVATVHRFQGSERDVIIFDTVESNPVTPSLLLNDVEISDRLANVAISRARGKFIFISDSYLRTKLDKKNGLKRLADEIHTYSPSHQLTWNQFDGQLVGHIDCGIQKFSDHQEISQHIKFDLLQTPHEEIAISWASSIPYHRYFSEEWLKQVQTKNKKLPRFYFSGRGNSQLTFELKNTQKRNTSVIPDYSFIGIDRKVLWIIIPTSSRNPTILRLNMPSAIDLIYQFLEIIPSEEINMELLEERQGKIYGKCPSCGEGMYPILGEYGTPYLLCGNSTCNYQKKLDVQIANTIVQLNNLVCEKCGSMAKGRKGDSSVFIGCSNYPNCKWTKSIESLI